MGTQRDSGFLRALARRFSAPAPLHVLIVDPNLTGAQALAGALGREHSVAVIGTAEAALHAIELRPPTLVVTELDLPGASGLELLATLRGRAATRDVLLMVLTARASVRDKIMAFQTGVDDYLIKPVEPATFAQHVQRLSRFRQTQIAGSR